MQPAPLVVPELAAYQCITAYQCKSPSRVSSADVEGLLVCLLNTKSHDPSSSNGAYGDEVALRRYLGKLLRVTSRRCLGGRMR
jgi:hypothetical protein